MTSVTRFAIATTTRRAIATTAIATLALGLAPIARAQDAAVTRPRAVTPDARAQSSAPKADPPAAGADDADHAGVLAHLRDGLGRLADAGLHPAVGIVVAGSSLSFGIEARDERFGTAPIGGAVEAWGSLRGYQVYAARLGRIADRDTTLRLAPADENLTGLFDDGHAAAPGFALYVDARYRDYPRMHFYGIGADAVPAVRADYGVAGTTMDVVAQWQRRPWLGFAARAGVTDLDVGRGSDSHTPDVEDAFGPDGAPGLRRHPRFLAVGVAAAIDRRRGPEAAGDRPPPRGAPSSGAFVGAAIWHFHALNGEAGDVTRVAIDGRRYWTAGTPDRVIAVRGLLSIDRTPDGAPTPFYLQYSLGGGEVLRGFDNFRYRGQALAATSVELRLRVRRLIEVAPFVDAGLAAARVGSLGDGPLHVSPGLGLRVRTDERVLFRMDWAIGSDGQRVAFAFSQSF
ncbi:MAG: BamA/TamA family outer membrane protein [Vicinamibacterales bacterium]